MTFRNLFLLVGLTLFLGIGFTSETPRAQIPHKFKVHVEIAYDDEHIQTLIQSYFKRELRGLGDVVIVGSKDAQHILSIVATEPTYRDTGRKVGNIAIALMFLTKTPTGHYYSPDLAIFTGGIRDLDGLCKSIVAAVDTRNFEPIRELFN